MENNKTYQDYVNSIGVVSSAMSARSYATLEQFEFSLKTTKDDLYKVIESFKDRITSIRVISGIKYNLRQWVKYKYSEDIYNHIDNLLYEDYLSNITIWNKISSTSQDKVQFISHKRYQQLLQDIDRFEECNPEYYKTLVMAVYEGIYSNDKAVLWNLRGNDINVETNNVTMRYSDGKIHTMPITKELVNNLLNLSEQDTWTRKFVNGFFDVKIFGQYPDSIFKLERRSNSTSGKASFKSSYHSRLRLITNKYLGNNVTMRHIYLSGIAYRIGLQLQEKGISFREAFSPFSRNPNAIRIIKDEFNKSNVKAANNNFRAAMFSYLDVFAEDWEDQ